MRISDWSSDVCSSDLPYRGVRPVLHAAPARWAVAARLQARRLDDPAGASAQPRGRAGGAERGLSNGFDRDRDDFRSEEHTSELQSLMRISYAVFCLKIKQQINNVYYDTHITRLTTL